LSALTSPGKTGTDAALSAPFMERRHAVGTPDYLAPELLLGALTCLSAHLLSGARCTVRLSSLSLETDRQRDMSIAVGRPCRHWSWE
jgi:serine/threonine protein kinase